MSKLLRDFYSGDTVSIAQALPGRYLVRMWDGQPLVARITETEAYVGATMFGPPGHAYIYLIYGMHCCLNFVTEPEGEPSAVLLRGLEAVYGAEQMSLLRYGKPLTQLTAYQRKNFLNGPGKCCRALGLTRAENGLDLTADTLFLCDGPEDVGLPPVDAGSYILRTGKRIGIDYAEEAVNFPWRFWLERTNLC